MNECKIVIPSAGRSAEVSTTKYVNNCILCVPESEYNEYKEHNSCEIIVHPDTIKTLGEKRNWIIDKYKTVFMLDDDLKGMKRLYTLDNYNVSPSEAYSIIQETYFNALCSGAKLFGFNHTVVPVMYDGFSPISLTGYINGSGIGIIENEKLRFSTEIVGVNDFYISLLNAYYYRFIFKDMRFCFMQNSIRKNTGGLSKSRNDETEKKDFYILKRKFGNCIKLKKSTKAAKNTLKYGRTINLPF